MQDEWEAISCNVQRDVLIDLATLQGYLMSIGSNRFIFKTCYIFRICYIIQYLMYPPCAMHSTLYNVRCMFRKMNKL